jgi:hypothetical protein
MSTIKAEPEIVTVKARDIKPFHYGVWSVVKGDDGNPDSEPFCNTICSVGWSDDGTNLWFGMESHNFMMVKPDEDVEVIANHNPYQQQTRDKYAAWVLPEWAPRVKPDLRGTEPYMVPN